MPKPTKTKNGKWRIRLYLGEVDGTKKFKSITADKYKTCQELAKQYIQQNPNPTLTNKTVEQAITSFLKSKEESSKPLSPSTYKAYCSYQKTAYTEINHYKVFDLTADIIQEWVNEYSINHSPKTVKNAFSLLQSSIKKLNRNIYFSDIELPKRKKIEYVLPTDEQVRELIKISDPDMRLAIMLSAFSSLRRGEICGLQYGDLDGNVLHVQRSMVLDTNKEWIPKETKTEKSNRFIVLPKSTIDEINSRNGKPDEYIIPINPNIVSDRFHKLTMAVGIPGCRFHDLRHYFVSRLHSLQIPDEYILRQGGWSSDHVMKNVYRGTLSDYEKTFSEKANNLMDNLME